MPLKKPHLTFIESYCKSQQLRVDFAYTNKRKSKLGDHYWQTKNKTSQITVNDDENHDRLFFVSLHELAHAYVAHKFKRSQPRLNFCSAPKPHGKEWKAAFHDLLHEALAQDLFTPSLFHVLQKHATAPKANVYSDLPLFEAFQSLDPNTPLFPALYLKDLSDGDRFKLLDASRTYTRVQLRRKRYLCKADNQRAYAISPMAEIIKID